jgi:DNA repair protein RAD16
MATDDAGGCPIIDESEDSGSEFLLEEDSAQDEEDEEVMVDAAVRLSLQTASQINGAGPSSGSSSEPNPGVRRRAIAAERRLAARRRNTFKDSNAEEPEDSSDLSSEEPLAKVVASSQATKKSSDDTSNTSYADYMTTQKRMRKVSLLARRANKKAERASMQQLRRKLTHVSQTHVLPANIHVSCRPKERLSLYIGTTPS